MEIVEGTAEITDVDAFLDAVDAIATDHGVTIQAFDARYVVGREHVEQAVRLADRASERGERIARDEGVEILLYAAGRRQINEALAMGVSDGEPPVVAVVAGDGSESESAAADALADRLDPAETLDSYGEQRVCEFFEISDREREATDGDLTDLVCERVALLVVER
jgi:KEOPS complex subunit Cgi121